MYNGELWSCPPSVKEGRFRSSPFSILNSTFYISLLCAEGGDEGEGEKRREVRAADIRQHKPQKRKSNGAADENADGDDARHAQRVRRPRPPSHSR